ncbi:DNA internalization-related competence protein ComEC/Rec2 [Thermolongibacillus altinsuensis]|uniref:DNA internalization-related competence protein ComEC/Rec2 n=1 Tax=Thermolongibacillus altinsuensis TaxID=575256 RepID=UPI001FB4495E|nr:DNA internalization-related competence protein ComEC/Rec2 [Thermolongibacillus altinsuensis]
MKIKGNGLYFAFAAICGIASLLAETAWLAGIGSCLYGLFIILRKRNIFPFCTLVFIVFFALSFVAEQRNVTSFSSNQTSFYVRIISPVQIDGDQLKTTVRSGREKLQLIYRLSSEHEQAQWQRLSIGMNCSFTGQLEKPKRATNPYAFDYQQYLYRQRIHWLVKPNHLDMAHCHRSPLSLIEQLQVARQKGIDYIRAHFPNEASGFVQALIYGERRDIDPSLMSDYQTLGLIHLLAISGLHITLLTGGCFYILIRLGVTRERAGTILIVLLPFYVVVAGGAPSVVRASLMGLFVLIAMKRNFSLSALDAVSLACLVMLAKDPYTLFHIGFQLSFIVSASLILSSSIISKENSTFKQLFLTSLISQLSAWPLLLYHFYEISLLSIPLNVLFVPLYSLLILPLSLFSFFIHLLLPKAGLWIIFLLTKILNITNDVVEMISTIEWFTLSLGRPPVWLVVFYYVVIFFFFVCLEKKVRHRLHWYAFGFVTFLHFAFPFLNPVGEVVMLDVGQGDCIYIELPYRKAVYLIDTGGTFLFSEEKWKKRQNEFDIGEDVVVPFLKAKGVRTLDKLILTHGDYDHVGAAETVLHSLNVRELVVGKRNERNELEQQIVKQAKKQNILVREVGRGDRWKVNDAIFYVLSPNGEEKGTNDGSIVLYVQMGGARWLFTGDLEEGGEQRITSTFSALPVDILKVGHHGSRTSTSQPFLTHIHPTVALISVGRNNRYHHPHGDVIERLQQKRVTIFRTDEHGAIQIRYRKKISTFTTFPP